MNLDFTILYLSYHYPFSQQFQLLSQKDLIVEADVANFLQTTEQQVSRCVLDNIYAYASEAV